MWLDRLGSAPGAQGNGRPGGRGPYMTSQRPPRSSSLSLSLTPTPADSTPSLLPSRRASPAPSGGSLLHRPDQDQNQSRDAAAVAQLDKLLGASATPADTGSAYTITDDDLAADVDFAGLTLHEAARGPLTAPRSLSQLDADEAKLRALHESIQACDEVLGSVETNLTSFRNDLGAVAADIESLQARSAALNVRLDNRRAVERGLAAVVEDLSVPPALVAQIAEGPMDEAWVVALREVDKRVRQKDRSTNGRIRAADDLEPLLDKLVQRALERVRDFLVAQIKALRSPHINAQVIQQQTFAKFKELFAFLHRHHPQLASELCQAYTNTMRWYYSSQFARYARALQGLRLHALDRSDALGHDDRAGRKSAASKYLSPASALAYAAGTTTTTTPPHDAFSLGRRGDALTDVAAAHVALPSYVAEEDRATHYLELPFRHFNLALVDNATAEYTFMAAFFAPALSHTAIARHFAYTMEPTFALGQALTKTLLGNGTPDAPAERKTCDALGVLLCIRLNQRSAFALQRRKIPGVEGYTNATNMLLWPRFQSIMDLHCESVHALAAATTTPANAFGNDAAAGQPASVAPHVVTQRFGQLLHGILVLSADAGDDEPVALSLTRLRSEVAAFLEKYAAVCFTGKAASASASSASSSSSAQRRQRFLVNSYSLVLTIISDVPSSKLAADQKQHLEDLIAKYSV